MKVGDLVVHKRAIHADSAQSRGWNQPRLVIIVSDRSLRGDGSRLWFTTTDMRGWRNAKDYEVISESR